MSSPPAPAKPPQPAKSPNDAALSTLTWLSPPRLPRLPKAQGVAGHVRYTVELVRQLWVLRRQLNLYDEALRHAVEERDTRLVHLAEATLASPTPQARTLAFQRTLTALHVEQEAAQRSYEEALTELQTAQLDRRALETRLENQVEKLNVRLAATEHHRDLQRYQLEHGQKQLAQQQKALEQHERAGEARPQQTPPLPPEAQESQRAQHQQQAAQIQQRRLQLETQLELLTQLERDAQAEYERVREAHGQAQAEQEEKLSEAKAHEAALTKGLDQARHKLDHLDARKRAALIDLGREMLEEGLPEGDDLHAQAQTALAQVATIRKARRQLERIRGQLDLRPAYRVLSAILAVGVLLLFLALL